MPSIADLAHLSKAAYTSPAVVTYTLLGRTVQWNRAQCHDLLGFQACVYKQITGPSVLAIRGTDDAWDGLVDDVQIASGWMPPQARLAIDKARPLRGAWVTGHSLGGALAVITASHAGLPAVSFNAPGVMDACVQSSAFAMAQGPKAFFAVVQRCVAGTNIRNIRIAGDLVSSFFTTGLQSGRTAEHSAPACGSLDALCRHEMDTVLSAVLANPQNLQDLGSPGTPGSGGGGSW